MSLRRTSPSRADWLASRPARPTPARHEPAAGVQLTARQTRADELAVISHPGEMRSPRARTSSSGPGWRGRVLRRADRAFSDAGRHTLHALKCSKTSQAPKPPQTLAIQLRGGPANWHWADILGRLRTSTCKSRTFRANHGAIIVRSAAGSSRANASATKRASSDLGA